MSLFLVFFVYVACIILTKSCTPGDTPTRYILDAWPSSKNDDKLLVQITGSLSNFCKNLDISTGKLSFAEVSCSNKGNYQELTETNTYFNTTLNWNGTIIYINDTFISLPDIFINSLEYGYWY